MPSLCLVTTVDMKDLTMKAQADIVNDSKLSHTAGTMDNIIQDVSPNIKNTEAPRSRQADVYVHGKEHP